MSKKKEMEFQHELRMRELEYERITELMKIEKEKELDYRSWLLKNNPQAMIQQPQQQFQPQSFQQQPFQEHDESMEEKSRKLYGGRKNG